MPRITTHILDLAQGQPAPDVPVKLECSTDNGWRTVADGTTDADGRWAAETDARADHRLRFESGAYFARTDTDCFHPFVEITFSPGPEPHYHVPLLLSPFGYSTYRGS